uniref:Uncharacterized protein n=1 Tax=Bacillus phage Adastra TaxID=3143958 RepID=A0AAU8BDK6_9CAUD
MCIGVLCIPYHSAKKGIGGVRSTGVAGYGRSYALYFPSEGKEGAEFRVLLEVYVDTAFTNTFGDQNLESLPEVY